MKFHIEMAEKEVELLEQNASESASSQGLEDKSGLSPWSQMTWKEENRAMVCRPLREASLEASLNAADFVPAQNSPAAVAAFPGSTAKVNIPGERTVNESSTRDVDTTAILLKLIMLLH